MDRFMWKHLSINVIWLKTINLALSERQLSSSFCFCFFLYFVQVNRVLLCIFCKDLRIILVKLEGELILKRLLDQVTSLFFLSFCMHLSFFLTPLRTMLIKSEGENKKFLSLQISQYLAFKHLITLKNRVKLSIFKRN